MSFIDQFNERMKGVRQSKNAVLIGLVLTLVACVLLTLVSYLYASQILCLLPMLVAFLAYGIPTYFGLKDRKKLALFGLALFLVVGLALGSALYSVIDGYEPEDVSSDDNALIMGNVTPSHGLPGDTYTFSVTLSSNDNDSNVRLLLVNNWGDGTGERNISMAYQSTSSLGALYQVQLSDMAEGIYYYQFLLVDGTGDVLTAQSFGPVNAEMGKVLSNSLISGVMVAYLNMAVLFYILVLLTWWMDRSKKKIFEMEQQRADRKKKKEADEKFVCSDCGMEVPSDADKCPGCGAKFDDDEIKCPQCNAKLIKSDTKCWNCGKKL